MVESCLLFPWFVFLFVGALDAGFDLYALIGVQSAARIAVLYTATSSTDTNGSTACTLVLQELNYMPNVHGKGLTTCSATPVTVTTGTGTDQYGYNYSTVQVIYQTVALMPIPGVLAAQFTITRTAQMMLRS
jgi:Flp pilus assembly protein TadG